MGESGKTQLWRPVSCGGPHQSGNNPRTRFGDSHHGNTLRTGAIPSEDRRRFIHAHQKPTHEIEQPVMGFPTTRGALGDSVPMPIMVGGAILLGESSKAAGRH